MLEKRCIGCGRFVSEVPRFSRRNLCVACELFHKKHGTYTRGRLRRDRRMTEAELRDWLVERCRWEDGHLVYHTASYARGFDIKFEGIKYAPARLHWRLVHGWDPVDYGLLVLHHPECEAALGKTHWRCIALDHLLVGTKRDNAAHRKIALARMPHLARRQHP